MSPNPLKIKISRPATEQPTKPAPRKTFKRRITSDDDDSDNADSPLATTPPSKPLPKKPRLSSYPDDVDRERNTLSPRPQTTSTKSRGTTGSTKVQSRKKPQILSDSDDDDEFVPPKFDDKAAVATTRPKMPKGRTKAGSGGGAMGKLIAKNEGRSAESPATSSNVIGKKRPRKEEETQDVEVDVTSIAAPNVSAVPPLSEAELPKKKLPTIKKKCKTDSVVASTFVSPAPALAPKASTNAAKISAGAGPARPQLPPAAGLPKKPTAPVQATTMNPSGTGDFDLRDSNTWQSLIGKGNSNSGPRIGVEKRVSAEERRKQLDKMRNDARAQREEQHRHTFDLQAQSQKIAAFEKKFALHSIRISGPNVLGAAFKARPIPSRSQPAEYRA